jgi:predicted RND superfamily exporter protein
MAFTTLVVGHLNILTITFAPILIGLAIDFGVHFITRFEEELRLGKTAEAAVEKAMVYTGLGIITGALTTAGAFLAMGVTNFKGIQEMGIICGGGMIVCLIPMLTTLPALLLRGQHKTEPAGTDAESDHTWRARIERTWLDRPVLVAVLTAALCGVAAVKVGRVYFNYDLLDMQSPDLTSVIFEKKLVQAAPRAGLFAVVVATNLEQAVDLEDRIKKLPTVGGVDSMSHYLRTDSNPKPDPTEGLGDQVKKQPTLVGLASTNRDTRTETARKLDLIREVKRDIATVKFAPADEGPVDIERLRVTLWRLQGYLGLAVERIPKDQTNLTSQLISMRNSIVSLRAAMNMEDPKIQRRLQQYQAALFSDIRGTFEALRGQDDSSGLKPEDLPPVLRHRFIGTTGKFLLQVYPKENVWERGPQERFVRDLRTVAPDVTGTPVQLYTFTTLLKDSYEQAAEYALVAIAIMVLLHFRSPVCVVLALLPVAVGSLWMGGFMGWFNIPFNPANIMTLPLVIGIGVTNGIHILNRFAEEGRPGILGKSTGKAVLVSGLTAISGFGSLILAKHQGIQSLGLVMSAGITTCMVAALLFLPALLNLLMKAGWMIK